MTGPSSLRSRLLGAFGLLAGALLVVSVLSTVALTRLGGAVGLILKENYVSVVACEEMSDALHREDAAVLLASRGQLDLARPLLSGSRAAFELAFAKEAANITIPGEGELVSDIRARDQLYRRTIDSALASQGSLTSGSYLNDLVPLFHAVNEKVLEIQILNQRNMEHADHDARLLASRTLAIAVAISVISIFLVAWLVRRLRQAILAPLTTFAERSRAIGEGRLDADIPVPDVVELATLAEALRRMQDKLRAYRASSLGELLAAKDLSRATVEAMPEPVLVFGPRAELLLANEAASAIFGLSTQTASEQMSIRTDIPDPIALARDGVLASGEALVPQSLSEAMRWISPSGERYFLVSAAPLRMEDTEKMGALVIAQEATRFRRIDALKSDVVATVSHELKTPLTSLRMATHLLLEQETGPLTAMQRELASTAMSETERLQSTVNELLDLVRIEREAGALHRSEVSARSLLLEVERAVHGIAQQRQISVIVEAPEDLLVPIDPEQMAIVLTNLASNAVRHSREGSNVWLQAEASAENRVIFRIRDKGEGIKPEHLPHIFERHWSGADPATLKGRHGLGLAIAREIVERHEGTLEVESVLGVGTVFSVSVLRLTDQTAVLGAAGRHDAGA